MNTLPAMVRLVATQRRANSARGRTQRSAHPSYLPAVPLYGLGKAWSGRRRRDGSWNAAGQWLSYGLLHFRGRYWDTTKPRLVVGHELKGADRVAPLSLNEAALQAVATFLSDNYPPRLADEDYRSWIRAELNAVAREGDLGAEWEQHDVHLDGLAHPCRIKFMPAGYCIVAETAHSYLAISARRWSPQLRLAQQDDLVATYKG